MMNRLLCFAVFFFSIKRKEYRHTIVSSLMLVYFVLVELQSSYENVVYANLLGISQKLVLIVLVAFLIYLIRKCKDGRHVLFAFVLTCVACVFRFLRSFAFDWYTGRMTQPGADVMAINENFTLCYNLLDSVVNLAIFVMLCCIAWHLGRDSSKAD